MMQLLGVTSTVPMLVLSGLKGINEYREKVKQNKFGR